MLLHLLRSDIKNYTANRSVGAPSSPSRLWWLLPPNVPFSNEASATLFIYLMYNSAHSFVDRYICCYYAHLFSFTHNLFTYISKSNKIYCNCTGAKGICQVYIICKISFYLNFLIYIYIQHLNKTSCYGKLNARKQ